MIMEETKTKYYIDVNWYDKVNRSFSTMAIARMCESCKGKLGTETQERVAAIDPRNGRIVYEMRNVPFAQHPMSVIRGCCSKRRDYITSETPVAEALFRVYLASSNQPMELERLREELGNYVAMSERPHNYAPELLARVIGADTLYGLGEFILPTD